MEAPKRKSPSPWEQAPDAKKMLQNTISRAYEMQVLLNAYVLDVNFALQACGEGSEKVSMQKQYDKVVELQRGIKEAIDRAQLVCSDESSTPRDQHLQLLTLDGVIAMLDGFLNRQPENSLIGRDHGSGGTINTN